MKIDLHIHSKTGSDGALPVEDIFAIARDREMDFVSITDHDSLAAQEKAITLAGRYGIRYVTGIELNVTFTCPSVSGVSLDFLGYQYDIKNRELGSKLQLLRKHRELRASQILKKLNMEFAGENIKEFTPEDMANISSRVDGAFGRPHIADYLIEKGIVETRQEAFDKYLVKCDVPKYPLSLKEAAGLIRNAGGILVLAHPGNPGGTSLATISQDLNEQTGIIARYMLDYIDGIECWHSAHDAKTVSHYVEFAKQHGLIMTGGSDCHQKPVILGTVDIPGWVARQFHI